MTNEFDAIATEAWERTTSPLDRFARIFGLDEYEQPKMKTITYQLWADKERANQLECHLCGALDKWTLEGAAFVHDHSRQEEYCSIGCRAVSSVPVRNVRLV